MALLPFLTSSLALAVAATLASAVASVQEVRADLPVADSCSSLGESSSCIDVLADEYADESVSLLQHAAQFNLLQVQRQQQHEQMSQNPSQPNSELLNMINQGIAQEVIPMMNSMLPGLIKKEGKDPLANVIHKDNLDMTDLCGLSGLQVSSITATELSMNATTNAATAAFVIHAQVPTLLGKIAYGTQDTWQLDVSGLIMSFAISATGSQVGLGINFTTATVLSSELTFASVKMADGSGPFSGLVEDVANMALQERRSDLETKVSQKMTETMQHALNKMLPLEFPKKKLQANGMGGPDEAAAGVLQEAVAGVPQEAAGKYAPSSLD